MQTKLRKAISLLLCVMMLCSLLPAGGAFAAPAQPGLSIVLTKTDGGTDSITIDDEGNPSATSGDSWTYDKDANKLTLNGWSGQKISANGAFDLHLVGENTITMKNESNASGIQISSTTQADINVTADTNGKLTIKSPDSGLTNSYQAVSFPNISGQFAGTLNIKSGEVAINITSSYGADSSNNPIGYGVAGKVAFENKETNTAKLTVALSSTTEKKGALQGLRNLDVSGVTGAEISVNVSATSKDVKATAISGFKAENSGAKVTATATNTDANTPALNKLAIGSANKISLVSGGKITANGCVLVPESVWNGGYFIDVIYGKTKTTTPADNKYLLVKGNDYYPPAVMSDTTNKQPLTTVIIEPADAVPTLTWLGGEITIPAGKVNESIDKYSFYPYLRGISAYDNLSVKVTSGSLPKGLSYNISSGISGKRTETCDAGTATITFKDNMGTSDTNDDRTVDIMVNYGAVTWPKPVTGVSVAPAAVTVGINGTATVMGNVAPDDASYANLDVATSSDSGVATAIVGNPNESGQSTITVTGHSTGTATITVKSKENPGYTTSITVNVREATPNAAIDYFTEELKNLVPSAEYLIDGMKYTADTTGRIAITSDYLNKTLGIIKKGESDVMNSDAQTLVVPARAAAPTGLTTDKASSSTATDGAIRGGSTTMEYRKAGSDDAWTQIHSLSTLVAAGSYEVRYRATDDSFASEPATVTVEYSTSGGETPGPVTPPAPPASGGGSGFSGKYNYPVVIDTDNHATAKADKNHAVAGDKVTITISPEAGYAVDEVIITDKDNKVITASKAGDNTYSFTMPEGKVKVAVTTEKATYSLKLVLQIGNKNIVANGKPFAYDTAPIIDANNRTLVPIRVITEQLGGQVDWNEKLQTVTLKLDGKMYVMTIGQTIPGFDTAAIIDENGRTLVPVRYVAEKLGARVDWIAATQQVVITK